MKIVFQAKANPSPNSAIFKFSEVFYRLTRKGCTQLSLVQGRIGKGSMLTFFGRGSRKEERTVFFPSGFLGPVLRFPSRAPVGSPSVRAHVETHCKSVLKLNSVFSLQTQCTERATVLILYENIAIATCSEGSRVQDTD